MADTLYELQRQYLIEAAKARGIDPDVAIRAMEGEGLAPGVWQSQVKQPYGRERSYGAMQLHVAPEGRKPGLGNEFIAKTGLDPADPKNYKAMIDFGLDNVVKGGWSPWFGAKAKGVTGMMGVGDNAQVMPASYSPNAETPYASPRAAEVASPRATAVGSPVATEVQQSPLEAKLEQWRRAQRMGSDMDRGLGPSRGAMGQAGALGKPTSLVQMAEQMALKDKTMETGTKIADAAKGLWSKITGNSDAPVVVPTAAAPVPAGTMPSTAPNIFERLKIK